jgi:hypothetical protein
MDEHERTVPAGEIEFMTPISIEGVALQESVLVAELPADVSAEVLRAYRLVLAWVPGRQSVGQMPEFQELRAWEAELLKTLDADTGLWAPVAVIAGELEDMRVADGDQLSRACMALAEWAFGCGAPATGLLFIEAAALANPFNSRLAYVAGRVLMERGRIREADRWLRRAMQVAADSQDEQARALIAAALQRLSGLGGA